MKIDWSAAPEWAKYAAMDKSGKCYYYEDKPNLGEISWLSSGMIDLVESEKPNDKHWKLTLTERPKTQRNMKPFDYDEAVFGVRVITRHGKYVEQLTEFKLTDNHPPLVGVVEGVLYFWNKDGTYNGLCTDFDLFLESETHEGYIGIACKFAMQNNWPIISTEVYKTEEQLKEHLRNFNMNNYIITKITWKD